MISKWLRPTLNGKEFIHFCIFNSNLCVPLRLSQDPVIIGHISLDKVIFLRLYFQEQTNYCFHGNVFPEWNVSGHEDEMANV